MKSLTVLVGREFIVDDFYYIDQFVSNIIILELQKKKTRQIKIIYRHYFVSTSINDLINITKGIMTRQ